MASLIDMLLGKSQGQTLPEQLLAGQIGNLPNPGGPNPGQTPGFNPNENAFPQPKPQGLSSKIGGAVNKLDSFMKTDGGSFLMNLLAQQGYSTMPQSRLGAIGRAGIATSDQKAARQQAELEKRLIESQIGLNTSKANAGPGGGAPLTELAKIEEDFRLGRIPPELYQAKRQELLSKATQSAFDNEQQLRGEYTKSISGTQASLRGLDAASVLIQTADNPTADLAAFISTIRSIDNSTVREGELAAFNQVQGIAGNLANLISQAQGKGFSVGMRRDIAELINKLREPLNQVLQSQSEFYSAEAKKKNLDPQSVVGMTRFGQSNPINLDQFKEEKDNTKPPPASGDSLGVF